MNTHYNQWCHDTQLWRQLYHDVFGDVVPNTEQSWYDNYKTELQSQRDFRNPYYAKIDPTKTSTQNLKEYHEFELVLYKCRPFRGLFRKIVPLDQRQSKFKECYIKHIVPIDVLEAKQDVVYYIYHKKENNPVSPIFNSQAKMRQYAKSKGWKLGHTQGYFFDSVNNYTTYISPRSDLK